MVAWLFSRTCAVAKYDPETKAWALKRSSGACDKTGVACGETDSFSLYSAVTIREYDNGAAPRLGCGGGCIGRCAPRARSAEHSPTCAHARLRGLSEVSSTSTTARFINL